MFNISSLLHHWLKHRKPDTFGGNLPPEQKEAWRIAGLLTAYITRKQTRKQKRELNEWLEESDENIRFFEKLTDANFITATKEIFRLLHNLQRQPLLTNPSFSDN